MKPNEPIENKTIQEASPALFAALSPLGHRVAFPPDIPFQAAQARDAEYNGTIGQITDGEGGAIGLEEMESALSGLSADDRNRALQVRTPLVPGGVHTLYQPGLGVHATRAIRSGSVPLL